jgi:hypothetical protein
MPQLGTQKARNPKNTTAAATTAMKNSGGRTRKVGAMTVSLARG